MAFPIKLTEEDRSRIFNAAKYYKDNLLSKTVTFLAYQKVQDCNGNVNNRICAFETTFKKDSFAHFVGLSKVYGINSAKDIYNKSIDKTLKSSDVLSTRGRGAMQAKLDVFKEFADICSNCLYIGKYTEGLIVNLNTDFLVGKTPVALGLLDVSGDDFVPNTLLNTDIREITDDDNREIIKMCFWRNKEIDNKIHASMIDKKITDTQISDVCHYLSKFKTEIEFSKNIKSSTVAKFKEEINKPNNSSLDTLNTKRTINPSDVFANAKKRAGEVNKDKKINKNLGKNRNI